MLVEGLDLERPYKLRKARINLDFSPLRDPDSILIKTAYVGICKSDVAVFEGKEKYLGKEMFGHEGLGIVVKKGKDVRDVEVGDYVSSFWHPAYCKMFVAPKNTYVKVPELHPKWILQQAACVLNAVSEHRYKKSLVVGSGYNALVIAQVCPDAKIVGSHNRELFKKFGKELYSWDDLKGEKFDVVIECGGKDNLKEDIEHMKEGGTFVLMAPPSGEVKVDFFPWSWKAIKVEFPSPRTKGFIKRMKEVKYLVEKGVLNLELLHNYIFDFDDYQNAFEMSSIRRPKDLIKSVLKYE